MKSFVRRAIGLMFAVAALWSGPGCQPASQPSPSFLLRSTTRPATVPHLLEAKELFYRAVEGDAEALDQSERLLADAGGPRSADPEVVAYYGAVDLLRAARTPWPLEKMGLANAGLALEDRAVAESPGDLEIRFLRGVTEYKLPRFIGRWPLACADLAYVARDAEAAARAGRLDPRAAAADLDYHGRVREQDDDAPGAIAAWRAAVRVDAQSPGGRDALKHLGEHGVAP